MGKDRSVSTTQIIDDETFFRYVYLPYLLVQVIWDYADSVLNLAAQMRIQEVKRLGYVIRELSSEYEYRRRQHMSRGQLANQERNMIFFQEESSKEIEQILSQIGGLLRERLPEINSEWRIFYSTVYLTEVLISTFKAYARFSAIKLKEKYGNVPGSLIPPQVAKLGSLIPQYLGEKANVLTAEELIPMGLPLADILENATFEGNFLESEIELPDVGPVAVVVARIYHVDKDRMLGSESKECVQARSALCFILSKRYSLPTKVIAKMIHRRVKTIEGLLNIAQRENIASDGRIGTINRELSKI